MLLFEPQKIDHLFIFRFHKQAMNAKIAMVFVALGALIMAGCIQEPAQPPEEERNLTVKELLDGKDEFLNKHVAVVGPAAYSPMACTEMWCYFDSIIQECRDRHGEDNDMDYYNCLDDVSCEPGERRECNTCSAKITMGSGDLSVELRKSGDHRFRCTGKEVLVCESNTEYDFSGCYFEEGAEYRVTGILKEEQRAYDKKLFYYIEVEGVKKV